MSKFKVGDKVRLLAKDQYDVEDLTVGEIGVVRSVTSVSLYPIRVDFPSSLSNFKEENIKLVEAESATPATSEATYESPASLVNAYLESTRAYLESGRDDRHAAFRALNEGMKPYYESTTRRARETALVKLTDDDCEALGIIR